MSSSIIASIAQQVGVSERTVLRVLTGDGPGQRVGLMARAERIRALAGELGYRPNAAARAVVSGRFHCFGLLCGRRTLFGDRLPEGMLRGLLEALAERNWGLLVEAFPSPDALIAGERPHLLQRRSVDGLLVACTGIPAEIQAEIEQHFPAVIWYNQLRAQNAIFPDDHAAAFAATLELLRRGHRRIAWWDPWHTNDTEEGRLHFSNSERKRGYTEAMASAGHPPRLWLEIGSAAEYAEWLRNPDERPSAVLGNSPVMLLALENAALHLGLTVPRDLSLVTLADEFGLMGLSGWHIPQRQIGIRAAAMLWDRLANPGIATPSEQVPFLFQSGRSLR